MPIATATVTRTAATKRGARARKLRLKREPSAQPSSSCAPLSNTRGIAEVLTPAIVSGIVIKSAPKTKALGTFRRVSSRPAAAVSDSSAARAQWREIQTESGADDPLGACLPSARQRADRPPRDARRRNRKQGADHPRQRRMQSDADKCRVQ